MTIQKNLGKTIIVIIVTVVTGIMWIQYSITSGKENDGVRLVENTNVAFNNMSSSSAKAGKLMGMIAHSSHDQAKGIQGANLAVSEMRAVIDEEVNSAATASAASDALQRQSIRMQNVVGKLQTMLGSHNRWPRDNSASRNES